MPIFKKTLYIEQNNMIPLLSCKVHLEKLFGIISYLKHDVVFKLHVTRLGNILNWIKNLSQK